MEDEILTLSRNSADGRRTSTWAIALGAGCNWSATLLAVVSWSSSEAGRYPYTTSLLGNAVVLTSILVAIVASYRASNQFTHPSAKRTLATGGIVLSILVAIVSIIPLDFPFPLSSLLVGVLVGFQQATFIVFWGLCFTHLDKAQAERTVFLSLGLCFVLYLMLSPLGSVLSSEILVVGNNVLKALGVVPYLLGYFSLEQQSSLVATPGKPQALRSVLATRVVFGTSTGIANALVFGMAFNPQEIQVLNCIVGFGIAGTTLAIVGRQTSLKVRFLTVTPLLIPAVVLLPFFGETGDQGVLLRSAGQVINFLWLSVSSVQLASLKGIVGWSEPKLALYDKCCYVVPWITSWVLTLALGQLWGPDAFDPYGRMIVLVLLFVSTVLAVVMMSDIMSEKIWAASLEKASRLLERHNDEVFRAIAASYHLTNQELQVLKLMAEGRTKAAIAKELVVAESTVRFHAKNLYRKLDVHSLSELSDLIRHEREINQAPKTLGLDHDAKRSGGTADSPGGSS